MTKHTPMIKQYLAIKEDVKDAFLFFRLGDFYELFFEDAIQASQLLEITLTGRDSAGKDRIPMCGVPHHSAETYINRLIQRGYKVAICEQMEDPAQAKGVVKREVVRIITPGTVMDSSPVGKAQNNFIVSLAESSTGYGLTACDLSTGELYQTELDRSFAPLIDEAFVYNPAEIVLAPPLRQLAEESLARMNAQVFLSTWEDELDEWIIERHFAPEEVDKLAEFGTAAKASLAQLLAYLEATQKRSMPHMTRIEIYESRQFMTLDPFTRRNLELVETVRDRSKHGSLFGLLDQTVTAMGSRMLKRWINKPLMNSTLIEERQEAVAALVDELIWREELKGSLKQVYDLERLVGRISFGTANARDFIALKNSLAQVPDIIHICRQTNAHSLQRLVEGIDPCEDVLGSIADAIVDDPPISVKEGGMIRSGYDQYLDKLKEASSSGKQWISDLEQEERAATGIKNLKVGFNRVFGYYIEVSRANIGLVPEGRYERKQTLANAERYITPELKEKEALILEAEEKMFDLEYELFVQLRRQVAQEITRLQRLADVVATLDVFQSLASVAVEHHYCRPEISDQYDMSLKAGRHPVVEAVMQKDQFIENDTSFLSGQKMLLITGPNMAGKSTYMRQVALACILAQIGSFVPAQAAHMPIVDRIFTRIGAGDDLIGGQSTFMVEMMDIQVMTAKATERSLVIIDELGRGTSTAEGMAIAQAVIEFLHHQLGCKTLVSTHFHELAHLQDTLEHLKNYSMAVKESDQDITFLRKLVPGAAGTSYGIYCAQLAGIPQSIIARSYELLNSEETGHEVKYDTDAVKEASAASEQVDTASSDWVQLSLFEEEVPAAPSNEKQLNLHTAQVFEQIQTTDLLNLTPLQAMQLINEWKQLLQQK